MLRALMRSTLYILGLSSLLSACHGTSAHEPDFAVAHDLGLGDLLPAALTLATTQTLTNCLTVDATAVYFIDEGSVGSDAGPTGGVHAISLSTGQDTTLASNADPSACTAVANGQLYYSGGGTLYAVPTSGGSAPTPLATHQHPLPARAPILAADATSLYWVSDVYGAIDAYNGKNAIVSVAVSGAAGHTQTVADDLVGEPGAFVLWNGNFYYSDRSGDYFRSTAGGAATKIGQGALFSNHLTAGSYVAVDEVTGIGTGDVAVFALDGSQRTVVATTLVGALAVDDSGVYANRNGQLMHYSLDGKRAAQLTLAPPRALALDGSAVYFTDGAAIYKISK